MRALQVDEARLRQAGRGVQGLLLCRDRCASLARHHQLTPTLTPTLTLTRTLTVILTVNLTLTLADTTSSRNTHAHDPATRRAPPRASHPITPHCPHRAAISTYPSRRRGWHRFGQGLALGLPITPHAHPHPNQATRTAPRLVRSCATPTTCAATLPSSTSPARPGPRLGVGAGVRGWVGFRVSVQAQG